MPDPQVTVAVNRSPNNCYGYFSMHTEQLCAFHLSGIYFRLREKNKMGEDKREALTSKMARQRERGAPAGRSRSSQLMCHRTHGFVEAQMLYKEAVLSCV